MNIYLPNLRLPSTYQEVEYIQSSGTQYINTGYIPNQNTKLTMNMGGWTSVSQYTDLFGARKSWTSSASAGLGFMVGWDNGGSQSYGMFGGSIQNLGPLMSFTDGNNHSIELSQSGIYQDGALKKSLPTVTFTSPGNLYIFALNDNGTLNEKSSFKLYSCKIYESSTLVRDFIPCYRKSDSVIGLYDLVNNQFYTNSGTGTFSKGSDVLLAELKNAYIGEYYEWTPDASRTLLYLPLESNTNDYSGNNRTCTPTSVSFTTVGGVKSAHVGTTGGIIVTPTNFITTSTKYKTTSVLVYWTSSQTSARRNVWEWAIQNTNNPGLFAIENSTSINCYSGGTSGIQSNSYMNDIVNKWTLITETIGDGAQKFYINGELKQTNTYSSALPAWGSRPNSYQQSQTVFNSRNGVSASQGLNGNAREIIFENILRSDEDVSKYYQRIKAKLGF